MVCFNRRQFLTLSALGLGGCGASIQSLALAPGFPKEPWHLSKQEKSLLDKTTRDLKVVTLDDHNKRILRRWAKPVPPHLSLENVAKRMQRVMENEGGVGIAGPQVGLSLRIALLKLNPKSKTPRMLFVRNPVIVDRSNEVALGFEGCLSIPEVGGKVKRHSWIKVKHTAEDGTILTETAEGFNAVLWQHELDHLDGVLYIDRLQGELMPIEEMRRRRKEEEDKRQKTSSRDPAPCLAFTTPLDIGMM